MTTKCDITMCDITIGKQMTLNTGNYTSIRPSISITIKDIDADNIGDINNKLNALLNLYFTREISVLQQFKNEIDDAGGPKKFDESMSKEQIDKMIKEAEDDFGKIIS